MHKNYIFRGIKRLIILKIISDGAVHGSEIQKLLAKKYDLDVPKPVVYTILRKMEEDGLIASTWETPESGPVKRMYTITDEGYKWMISTIGDLKKMSRIVDELLEEFSSIIKLEAKRNG